MNISHYLILIVDDDDDDRYIIDHSFREIHWNDHIKLVDSGEKLFHYLEALPDAESYPALILLDYHMPRMSAEEILRKLKNNKAYHNIMVMVYSSLMTESLCSKLQSLGALSCYEKVQDHEGALQLAGQLKNVVQPTIV